MFNKADKKFAKLGFTKEVENDYVVEYSRKFQDFDFTQKIEISHKAHADKHDNCHCIVFSYDSELQDTKKIGNTNVGMSPKLMKACLAKIKEKKW